MQLKLCLIAEKRRKIWDDYCRYCSSAVLCFRRPLTTGEQIKGENPRIIENWKASVQTLGNDSNLGLTVCWRLLDRLIH